jgi:hypothetical protein
MTHESSPSPSAWVAAMPGGHTKNLFMKDKSAPRPVSASRPAAAQPAPPVLPAFLFTDAPCGVYVTPAGLLLERPGNGSGSSPRGPAGLDTVISPLRNDMTTAISPRIFWLRRRDEGKR